MKREYWDDVAADYESQIFKVFDHDRSGLVVRRLKKFGGAKKMAIDFGCGIGDFLPALAGSFREVLAVDLSSRCLRRAQKRYAQFTNLKFRVADLASPRIRLPRADVALSVNSVIAPAMKCRTGMLNTICKHLNPGGHVVMVVPSLESSCLTDSRLIEWNLKDGLSPRTATGSAYRTNRQTDYSRFHEGVVRIAGVKTKHYLKEEIQILMQNRDMKVLEIRKIPYSWRTEFARPPQWMTDPHPWDWLCVAQKG